MKTVFGPKARFMLELLVKSRDERRMTITVTVPITTPSTVRNDGNCGRAALQTPF